jgi:hypothetical protein
MVSSCLHVSPEEALAGSGPLTLTVVGAGFSHGSVVAWNGSPLATQWLSARRLTAAVPATLLLQPGQAVVSVFNHGPGGGMSPPSRFTVRDPHQAPVSATATVGRDQDGFLAVVVNLTNTSTKPLDGFQLTDASLITTLGLQWALSGLPARLGFFPPQGFNAVALRFPPLESMAGQTVPCASPARRLARRSP